VPDRNIGRAGVPSEGPRGARHPLSGGRRRTIGVIGGMGPLATAAFMDTLARLTPAHRDQDHPRVVVDSDPSVPDRTAYLLGEGEDPRPALAAIAQRLERFGCELLVMPCNTAHAFADTIRQAVTIPFVDWIESTADAVLSMSPRVAGILATDGTIRAGLYQRALRDRGIHTVVPDADSQRSVMDAIYGVTGVKSNPAEAARGRDGLRRAAAALAGHGADVVILGCTELALAMPSRAAEWPVPTIDPADHVAARVIQLAMAIEDVRALHR
jgi:aspartate racemase